MGLGNKAQAFALALSAFFMALGTATATIPEVMPNEYRVPLACIFWACGIIGFALKEAIGSSYEPQKT
jgi:hypothetical protein